MGFLDWIKARGGEAPKQNQGEKDFDPIAFAREHGHASVESLSAEIRNDEKLAAERDSQPLRERHKKPARDRGHECER